VTAAAAPATATATGGDLVARTLAESGVDVAFGTRPSRVDAAEPYFAAGHRIATLPGVGHVLHLEDAELVAGEILAFLRRP
jgi:pimeloyl-ACP methyl ester carboxylesterase